MASSLKGVCNVPSEVEYGFTKNLGNYQSERLSLRLQLRDGQKAEEALDVAKQWVEAHLAIPEYDLDQAHRELADTQREYKRVNAECEKLEKRYAKLRSNLSELGMDLPDDPADLPF
jgi:chromosome segregation ATPase